MELIRDLVRDLVGIIFPGSLLIILTLWLLFGISIIFPPLASLNVFAFSENSVGFLVLLIFSYVAGQALRIRRLDDLERVCTEEYRRKYKSSLSEREFDESIRKINQEEEAYFAGQLAHTKLKETYKQHCDKFGIWEEFPYPYLKKGRRLSRLSTNYNELFEKYDQQGITKSSRFFNFCKSVIYEYSPSLKEEVIRQEALVRLFAGIYYVTKYGKTVSGIAGILHLAIIASFHLLRFSFLSYSNPEYSYGIVIVSVIVYVIFSYLSKEIVARLRIMRAKELDLAYDGFYIICTKHNFEMDKNGDRLQTKG